MASPSSPRFLSLGFMLIVLCLHQCCARKVLLEDLNKQEQAQPNRDVKSALPESGQLAQKNDTSKEGEIGLECVDEGCQLTCYEEPCHGHFIYPTPVIVLPPPYYVPPCTPCEPWYGPEPCPCPCEEGAADTEGIKTEGHESNNKAQEGEKQGNSLLSGKENIQEGALSTADAPLPAIIDGSNVQT